MKNIADNGGIRESFRAYMSSVDALGTEPVLPGLEKYTPEQMYFIFNAQLYCEVATEESFVGQIQSDQHSPGMSQKGIGCGILYGSPSNPIYLRHKSTPVKIIIIQANK